MPDTVKNPVSDVYKRWCAEVKRLWVMETIHLKEAKLLQPEKQCMHNFSLWEIQNTLGYRR